MRTAVFKKTSPAQAASTRLKTKTHEPAGMIDDGCSQRACRSARKRADPHRTLGNRFVVARRGSGGIPAHSRRGTRQVGFLPVRGAIWKRVRLFSSRNQGAEDVPGRFRMAILRIVHEGAACLTYPLHPFSGDYRKCLGAVDKYIHYEI